MQNSGPKFKNANMLGATVMCMACLTFALSNACMKLLLFEFPPFQLLFLRGCFVIVFCFGLCLYERTLRFPFNASADSSGRHHSHRKDRWLIFLRSACESYIAMLFFHALEVMPIFVLLAVLQAAPIFMTCVGFFVFKEKVGARRWSAILLGFCGVLLIIRPDSDGFDIYAILAVGAMLGVVLRDTLTRQLSKNVPGSFVGLCSAVCLTIAAGVICLVTGIWTPFFDPAITTISGPSIGSQTGLGATKAIFEALRPQMLLLFGSATLFLTYITSIKATRTGEIGFVYPFRYTIMIWAALIGLYIFEDPFDPLTVVGVLIVAISGLYTLWRERILQISRGNSAPPTH